MENQGREVLQLRGERPGNPSNLFQMQWFKTIHQHRPVISDWRHLIHQRYNQENEYVGSRQINRLWSRWHLHCGLRWKHKKRCDRREELQASQCRGRLQLTNFNSNMGRHLNLWANPQDQKDHLLQPQKRKLIQKYPNEDSADFQHRWGCPRRLDRLHWNILHDEWQRTYGRTVIPLCCCLCGWKNLQPVVANRNRFRWIDLQCRISNRRYRPCHHLQVQLHHQSITLWSCRYVEWPNFHYFQKLHRW